MMRCEKCGGRDMPELKQGAISVRIDGLNLSLRGIPKCEACGCARLTKKGLDRLRAEIAVTILRKERLSWREADYLRNLIDRLHVDMWAFDDDPPMSFIVDPVAVENADSWEWRLLK